MDHFARLGLAVSFDIDASELERRYFDMQRLLHPDRFAAKPARERALSQQQAASLNDAYEILKDPLSRADYMIHLFLTKAPPEGCNLVNDAELLTETIELREALSEAMTIDSVDILAKRAANDINACINDLAKSFAGQDLERACRMTTRLKYLRKLAEEARQRRAKVALR